MDIELQCYVAVLLVFLTSFGVRGSLGVAFRVSYLMSCGDRVVLDSSDHFCCSDFLF